MVNGRKKEPRFAIVIIVATVLLATEAGITTTTIDNASAYSKYQATTGANHCGNGKLPLNILCQNIDSEIQGEKNAVNMIDLQTGDDMNPTATRPPIVAPPPPTLGSFYTVW